MRAYDDNFIQDLIEKGIFKDVEDFERHRSILQRILESSIRDNMEFGFLDQDIYESDMSMLNGITPKYTSDTSWDEHLEYLDNECQIAYGRDIHTVYIPGNILNMAITDNSVGDLMSALSDHFNMEDGEYDIISIKYSERTDSTRIVYFGS